MTTLERLGRIRSALVISGCVIGMTVAVASAQESPLASVLMLAGTYVREYQQQLMGIVAEETYIQAEYTGSFGAARRRALKSDVLLVRPSGADQFVLLRDVFEVDGNAVRDREERLAKLFLEASPTAEIQVQNIMTESARYNIGPITRTVNVPTLALTVLDPRYQGRFRFERTSARTPRTEDDRVFRLPNAGERFAVSSTAFVVAFRETTTPTLIRTTNNRDLPIGGRLWIEPNSGRVLMTELTADDGRVSAIVDVRYDLEPKSQLLVPAAMREIYEASGFTVEGSATYGAVRRFAVQVQETFGVTR